MSRHRGAKLLRRCGLLGGISLLSPEYLLSVERWPFHTEPPDHLDRLSTLLDVVCLAVRLAYAYALKSAISDRAEPTFALLRYSLGGDRPSQTTHHAMSLTGMTGQG
jgi:Cell wall-associated hydrolase.